MNRGDKVLVECEVVHTSERTGRLFRDQAPPKADLVGLRLADGQLIWVRPQDVLVRSSDEPRVPAESIPDRRDQPPQRPQQKRPPLGQRRR